MRNPRLEELRKRLLTPPLPSDPPPYTRLRRAGEVFSPWPSPSEHPPAVESEMPPSAWTKGSAREVRRRPIQKLKKLVLSNGLPRKCMNW